MEEDLAVVAWLDAIGATPRCFGVTREGHPEHPLYLKSESFIQLLTGWRWKTHHGQSVLETAIA
jgi:hypothetical protein